VSRGAAGDKTLDLVDDLGHGKRRRQNAALLADLQPFENAVKLLVELAQAGNIVLGSQLIFDGVLLHHEIRNATLYAKHLIDRAVVVTPAVGIGHLV